MNITLIYITEHILPLDISALNSIGLLCLNERKEFVFCPPGPIIPPRSRLFQTEDQSASALASSVASLACLARIEAKMHHINAKLDTILFHLGLSISQQSPA